MKSTIGIKVNDNYNYLQQVKQAKRMLILRNQQDWHLKINKIKCGKATKDNWIPVKFNFIA